jgi:hypothetical protein
VIAGHDVSLPALCAGPFVTPIVLSGHTERMEREQTFEEHKAELQEYSDAVHDPSTTAKDRKKLQEEEAVKPLGPDEEI